MGKRRIVQTIITTKRADRDLPVVHVTQGRARGLLIDTQKRKTVPRKERDQDLRPNRTTIKRAERGELGWCFCRWKYKIFYDLSPLGRRNITRSRRSETTGKNPGSATRTAAGVEITQTIETKNITAEVTTVTTRRSTAVKTRHAMAIDIINLGDKQDHIKLFSKPSLKAKK